MSTLTRLTLPMPRLGETMEEGTIAEWLVAPGQSFKRGDPILEVETDKTLVEYPALGDGTLIEALVAAGDVVEVGAPIATIETADAWDGLEGNAPTAATPALAPPLETDAAPPVPDKAPPSPTEKPRATPLARRLAARAGIDLATLAGSGRRGRIEADDVRAVTAALPPPAPRPMAGGTALLVHGFAGLGSNWAALRAALQRHGIKAAAPDAPGHGANATEAPDVASLVEWLVSELAAQTDPLHLVGHSLGAHVAARAAARFPEKVARLTLLAPAGCGLEIDGTFAARMAAGPGTGELAHLMRRLGPRASALDSAALTAMAEGLRSGRLADLAEDMVTGDVQRIDTLSPLRSLAGRIPVNAIFGLRDRIIPRDHAFAMPPQVACHMVETGHMPHWDAVETVAEIITTAR